MNERVTVLGGGPAGLYAALLLARRRIPVVLFEREQTAGGLAASFEVEGQRVDHGSHRLHPSIRPDILEDLRDMLGAELQERERRGRIRMGHVWLSFPLAPGEIVTRLPPATTARLGAGALRAMFTPRSDETFQDAVATGLGRPMGELFYYPYARKIWGLDPSQLSGEQARRRVSADSPLKLLRKAMSTGSGRTFYYPAGGFGRIPEALATAADAAGAELRLGTAVESIERGPAGWSLHAGGEEHSATLVLSTLPIATLSRMLGPPPEVEEAAGALASRAMVLVYLTVHRPRWTPYDAHYFPGPEVPFTRISEPKNYRDSHDDPSDRSVICVELPATVGEGPWIETDSALADSIAQSLVQVGLPDPGTSAVTTRRLAHAYPIYRVGAEKSLSVVARWLDGVDKLVTFGRQGLFAHDNTHHALVMARDAVACITPELEFDSARWAVARERFRSHVVED